MVDGGRPPRARPLPAHPRHRAGDPRPEPQPRGHRGQGERPPRPSVGGQREEGRLRHHPHRRQRPLHRDRGGHDVGRGLRIALRGGDGAAQRGIAPGAHLRREHPEHQAAVVPVQGRLLRADGLAPARRLSFAARPASLDGPGGRRAAGRVQGAEPSLQPSPRRRLPAVRPLPVRREDRLPGPIHARPRLGARLLPPLA